MWQICFSTINSFSVQAEGVGASNELLVTGFMTDVSAHNCSETVRSPKLKLCMQVMQVQFGTRIMPMYFSSEKTIVNK